MGKYKRETRAGAAVHVWQRGNHQEPVFLREADNRSFLRILRHQCEVYRVRVFGYCLMTNHFHLVVAGETEGSISRAIGRANWEYSIIRHREMGRKGQLWQGRYGSCLLDEAHFWAALCYVERNPLDAGMVVNAWDWAWSSARAHIGLAADDWLDRRRWEERYDTNSWKRALEVGIRDEALEERIALGKIWYQTNPVTRHCGKGVGKLVAERGYGVDAAGAAGW